MENIIIFENFLDQNDLDTLLKIIETKEWGYGHTSGVQEKIENKFFSTTNDEIFFMEHLKNKIEQATKKKLKINRHYMHIQTFGLDGSYHTDDVSPDAYTFCIYISDLPDDTLENICSGEFYIKIPNEKAIIGIEPHMNRGIFFPSNYFHKGVAYNKMYPQKRLCITWKLELI